MKTLRFTAFALVALCALTGIASSHKHSAQAQTTIGHLSAEPTPICPFKVCPSPKGR